MLGFVPEKVKSGIKRVLFYDKLKDYYMMEKYKKYYHDNPDEFVVLTLPELSDYSTADAKDLYPYYWFAENITYYNFVLKTVSKNSSGDISKVLMNSNYGIMSLSYDMDTYFKDAIKSAERALIRKAIKNGYTCKQISYDDYCDDILEINTSKGERQGQSMGYDYLHIVKRDEIVKKYNPCIYTFGCFDGDGKLIAYYMFEKFTNCIHVNKGIGHLDHLNMGVMNYLFAYSVCELSLLHNGLYLVYGGYDPNISNGLFRFKKHVGCQRKTLVYQGSKQQFDTLALFLKQYSLHGDSGLNYVKDYILKSRV